LGCHAQAPSSSDRTIEHHVRNYFQIPANVQIQVGAHRPSEFANYDSVTVTLSQGDRKQNIDFLLSKDGKTLVRMNKLDLSKDPYADVMSKINVQGRPVRGNKDAKVTIVSYDDFQCPYCSRMHQQLFSEVLPAYKDSVRVIYKDFPLPMHEWATHAANNANCLAAQSNDAYWEMADYVHANQGAVSRGGDAGAAAGKRPVADETNALDKLAFDYGRKHSMDMTKLQACVRAQSDAAVRASVEEADGLGVTGTPTLYINGEKVDGAVPPELLREVINRALREAGQPLPAPPAPSRHIKVFPALRLRPQTVSPRPGLRVQWAARFSNWESALRPCEERERVGYVWRLR
jgi:protein-disulfide isomerase